MKGAAEAELPVDFRCPVRVYWEDTDGGGVVYYANYLKYLERARTEWLRSMGVDQSTLARETRLAFVVRALAVEFVRPARLDDALQVGIGTVRIDAAVVSMRQAIWRGEERLLHADVKLACVKLDSFLPARVPQFLRTSLAARSPRRPQIE
jgi:acyl-CoA thioester hydrolase